MKSLSDNIKESDSSNAPLGGDRGAVIIKYNAGNIQSVLYALERIGMSAVVTDDIELIQKADKVIFPGVGEASTAMNYLKERKLDLVIKNLKQPVLGICLGMQLMCRYSEENDTDCLAIFDEEVKLFKVDEEVANPDLSVQKINSNKTARPPSPFGESLSRNFGRSGVRLKIPQIGWNQISNLKSPLFDNIPENSYCYFVHGYYAAYGKDTIATADYVQPYSAGLHRNNFYGVQFHPEKSAAAGEQILKNFITKC
jgi:imidazole glycerol-phosphate synthase subunit HisH